MAALRRGVRQAPEREESEKGGWLKVGEVAARTGLSIRTLHHYDEIGLLRPGQRTPGGHRLYGRGELARLQQIRSLKQLGFSLLETKACLDDPRFSLERTLGLHRTRLDAHMERARALRASLADLERRVREDDLSLEELLNTIEETTMMEKYYTPEQLEKLAARREEVGGERMEAVQNHWLDLAGRVNQAMAEGLDPTEEAVVQMAREWRDLTRETVAGFSGGDPAIEASVARVWAEEPDMGSQWGMGPEVRDYIGRAMAGLPD